MSHPLYLSDCHLPRMPEGRRNEWRTHFAAPGGELEANAFFPLFWRVLFVPEDLRWAHFIDEIDVDDEAAAIEREETMEDFGPDARYPYLVTARAEALERLAARREAVLGVVGAAYAPLYDAFADWVHAQMPSGHVLLRTAGLPDAADAQAWLLGELASVQRLPDPAGVRDVLDDLRRADDDPVWRLSGRGWDADHPWPPAGFAGRAPRVVAGAPTSRAGTPEPAAARPTPPMPGWLVSTLEWLGGGVAAAAGLGTYALTRSGWWATLAFLATAVAIGLLALGWDRRRRRRR